MAIIYDNIVYGYNMAYIQFYILHKGGRQLLKSTISKLLHQPQYKGVFQVEFSFYEVLE